MHVSSRAALLKLLAKTISANTFKIATRRYLVALAGLKHIVVE
jgi:hypothetical protein